MAGKGNVCGRPNLPVYKPRQLCYRARPGGRIHRSAVQGFELKHGQKVSEQLAKYNTQPHSIVRAFLVSNDYLSVLFVRGQREDVQAQPRGVVCLITQSVCVPSLLEHTVISVSSSSGSNGKKS